MRYHPLRKLFPVLVLLLLSAPGFSQDNDAVRIGVAMLRTGVSGASDRQIRDHLVKALNRHKAEKNSKILVQAIGIDALPGSAAIAEAREKRCQFLLYMHLKHLENSSKVDPNNLYSSITITAATLEYMLKRVSDGAYATGAATGENRFVNDAILQATEKVSGAVVVNLNNASSFQPGQLEEAANEGEQSRAKLNTEIFAAANSCDWLPGDLAHADALRGVCQYAITLPRKIPNFICEQDTSRYSGNGPVPIDLITATVRYEDGNESYTEIKRNGKPAADAISNTSGLWATGVFEGNLRNIFDEKNAPKFDFAGEGTAGERVAWIFTYEIERQNERVWELRGGDQVVAPPYEGEVWIDQTTGEVLRFRSVAKGIPSTFPIERAELQIDYHNIEFGDGTTFVLPVSSTTATKYQGMDPTRNVVRFQGCQKFRAKTRLLLGAAGGTGGEVVAATSEDAVKEELEQNQLIYDILREQAIREDEARLEVEHKLDLNIAAVAVIRKLSALEAERERVVEQEAASVKKEEPSAGEPVSTIKVSVNLVPVSVVTRDASGHAVGTLIKDDFRLFDERKPQVISRFSVEKGEDLAFSQPPVHSKIQADQDQADQNQVEPNQGEQNNVALLFDDLHAVAADLASVKEAAGRRLGELHQQDRVGVFTTSGDVALDFTTSREKLRVVLQGLKAHSTPGWNCPAMNYFEADQIVNHGNADASDVAVQDALSCGYAGTGQMKRTAALAERLAMSRALEVAVSGRVESDRALGVLHDVIARTAAMTGRRTIVLVSPGFLTASPDAQDRAMAIIDLAIKAGVVINTLDLSGVPGTGVDLTNPGNSLAHEDLDRQDATARNELMADLAYGTGGTFFHNSNDMNEGFRRIADMPEFIYVLGFSPQKLDGKFHKLKVALNRREKLTVQARPGYYALKPKTE
jgi:VWFA-related protein